MDAPFGKQYLLIALCAVNRVKQKYQWNKQREFREGISDGPLESCCLVMLWQVGSIFFVFFLLQ